MKKIFIIALMSVLAMPMMQAQRSFATKAVAKQAIAGNRHTDRIVTSQIVLPKAATFNDPIPAGMARVTLTAGDVWQDGTGYQMLLDADATAYGSIIPETGALTSSGDAAAWIYEAFEYKIPENADGALNTANIVFNNSVSILIPAGVYDYMITNPSPGDRMWIASEQGNVGGRYDNYTFVAGKAYTFTVTINDETGNDQTNVVITDGEPGEEPVDPTTPESVTVVPGSNTANVAWVDNDDAKWNLRYRVYDPNAPQGEYYFWDFEEEMSDDISVLPGGWTMIDADGDGYNWYHLNTPPSSTGNWNCHSGYGHLSSASYNAVGALNPDNWLISPQVILNGNLSFWAAGQDPSWADEVFAVYVSTGGNTVNDFVKISGDITATSTVTEYTFDLSDYEGQEGYIAIRHYNVSDMFRLNIDDVAIGTPVLRASNPWTNVEGLLNKNYTIEDLAPETTYEVQVQAVNDAGQSEWTESTIFTTTAGLIPITEVYVNGYESPVDGENSQDHLNITVPEDANYEIYVADWSPEWWDNDVDDEFFGTFVGGTRYSLGVTIQAKEGYYFANNCVYYVNGDGSLVDYTYTGVDEDYNNYCYVWTMPEAATGGDAHSYAISVVYINGYESPVAGENSQNHLNITVPEDANYTIYVDRYSPEWWDNDVDDDFFGTFVEGTYYSVGLTIEANEGYFFTNDCVFYVNGSEDLVDYDYTGVDDEMNIYAYVWTIPEAAVAAPVEPTEKTGAPTFQGFTEDGIHAYFVEIIPTEPSVIYYRVIYPDGTESEWAEYEELLSFEGEGKYRVEAYAVADGKLPSEQIAYEFVVSPVTGIEEMMSGKQVANVRYFNMAGQEMQQADGMTIVVTTYTDGTTSAVKVVK